MRREEVRDKLLHHLSHPGADNDKAHEIYHDDAVLEFPQSGERFRGSAPAAASTSCSPPGASVRPARPTAST